MVHIHQKSTLHAEQGTGKVFKLVTRKALTNASKMVFTVRYTKQRTGLFAKISIKINLDQIWMSLSLLFNL